MIQRPSSVLASGYIALDVVRTPEATWLRAGGTAANVAAILAYLGWRSAVVGHIGDDDAGPIVERDLRAVGVDTSGLRLGEAGTPLVVHEVAPNGHRFRFGCASCGRAYRPHRPVRPIDLDAQFVAAPPADVFFFDRATNAALRLAALHREAGRRVVYEPGSTGRQVAHERAIRLADIVKFSDERRPQFEAALRAPAPGQVWIETRGDRGARLYGASGTSTDVQSFAVRQVDAGGAGDWFTAGLVSRLPDGTVRPREMVEAVRYGSALGALACLAPGARTIGEMLSKSELDALAARLMRGAAPDFEVSPIEETPTVGRCGHCRLPLRAAAS